MRIHFFTAPLASLHKVVFLYFIYLSCYQKRVDPGQNQQGDQIYSY